MPDPIERASLLKPSPDPQRAPCGGRHAGVLTETGLEDGCRVGRYVVLRDSDGTLYAVTATAVAALCECDDGCLLLLSGGRMIKSTHSLGRMLTWLT